jgi:myosin heavy subunit
VLRRAQLVMRRQVITELQAQVSRLSATEHQREEQAQELASAKAERDRERSECQELRGRLGSAEATVAVVQKERDLLEGRIKALEDELRASKETARAAQTRVEETTALLDKAAAEKVRCYQQGEGGGGLGAYLRFSSRQAEAVRAAKVAEDSVKYTALELQKEKEDVESRLQALQDEKTALAAELEQAKAQLEAKGTEAKAEKVLIVHLIVVPMGASWLIMVHRQEAVLKDAAENLKRIEDTLGVALAQSEVVKAEAEALKAKARAEKVRSGMCFRLFEQVIHTGL